MKCPHCQQEHPPESLFCPISGLKMNSPQVCPNCGKPVDPGWRNCTSCGTSFVPARSKSHRPAKRAIGFPGVVWLVPAVGLFTLLCVGLVIYGVNLRSPARKVAVPTVTPLGAASGFPTEAQTALIATQPSVNTAPPTAGASVLFTPYTGKIVFVTSREKDDNAMGNSKIYAMNADGSQAARIIDLGWSESPSLSADGRKLVFVSDDHDGRGIYVANADGSQPIRITRKNPGYYDLDPCWSADGSQIAFTSDRDGNFEIYVMNADGSSPKRLTNYQADDTNPVWSPDGQKIAFTSWLDGNMEIYVMPAPGAGTDIEASSPQRLTNNSMEDSHPTWSADGQKIAFQSFREGDRATAIYIMNADGSNPVRLTDTYSPEVFPVWLGEGQIVFVSERDGNEEIYIMYSDGSQQTRLTKNVFRDTLRGPMYSTPNRQPVLPHQPALPLP
ncbi:MAG: zinc ribbon domain-containing protein [Chloroflexota bacterium]